MSSVEKTCLLLRYLGEPPFEFSLTELAEQIGTGKSGTHKILQAMKANNIVIQDPSTKKYHLAPIVLRLGNVYSQYKGIREIAEPILEHIKNATEKSTYLTIWEGDRAFPAYKKCPPGGIYDYQDFIGKNIPFNAGASALVIFSFQPEQTQRYLLEQSEMTARTPKTIVDREHLLRECAAIRKRGYCIEDETFSIGVVSIAVPIFDRHNIVWASLSLASSRDPHTGEMIPHWAQALLDGAEELSYQLQFRH